jgi:hypothetical protein
MISRYYIYEGKNMKKYLLIGLMLLLLFAAVSGCKTVGDNPPDIPDEENKNDEVPESNDNNIGPRLSAAYAEMMKNENFYIKINKIMDIGSGPAPATIEVAVSGGNIAMLTEMNGKIAAGMIIKDGKMYMLEPKTKMAMVSDIGNIDIDDFISDLIYAGDLTFIGSGTEDEMIYEEYSTTSGTIRYYFKGEKLAKITVTENGVTEIMEVIEMTTNIPAEIFDIPADYNVI